MDPREREQREYEAARATDTWDEAVDALREHLEATDQLEELRDVMDDGEGDRRFPASLHLLGGGMSIRNWLRDQGFGEEEWEPVSNLDHVYAAIVYEAVWGEDAPDPGVRQGGPWLDHYPEPNDVQDEVGKEPPPPAASPELDSERLDELRADIIRETELESRRKEIVAAVLRDCDDEGFFEPAGHQYLYCCPGCKLHRTQGHEDGCPVAALLKLREGS